MGSHSFWKFSKTRVKKEDDEEDNNGVKLIKGRK
jgi:hypothetical protein